MKDKRIFLFSVGYRSIKCFSTVFISLDSLILPNARVKLLEESLRKITISKFLTLVCCSESILNACDKSISFLDTLISVGKIYMNILLK